MDRLTKWKLCVRATLLMAIIAICSLSEDAFGAEKAERLIVMPKAGVDLAKLHGEKSSKVKKKFKKLGGMEVLELPRGKKPGAAAREYLASGFVEFAEPDSRWKATALPNDHYFTNGILWGLNNKGGWAGKPDGDIDAPEAWEHIHSAPNVIVAVIDSGIRHTHEDLAENMWRNRGEIPNNGIDDDGNFWVDDVHGIDAIRGDGNSFDVLGHGTHVAGTIGAVGNNGKGSVGVCWRVQLMALKFMDEDGWGDTSDVLTCIEYALENEARVINASWGSSSYSFALLRALRTANERGVVIVTAAGNESSNTDIVPSYPGNYVLPNKINVAATTRNDELDTDFSNYGVRTVDIAAPGTYIYSPWFSSDAYYLGLRGTSMAAPHVTGAIALLFEAFPSEPHTNLIARLYAAAEPLSELTGFVRTGARLNIGNLFSRKPTLKALGSNTGLFRFEIGETNGAYVVEQSSSLAKWEPVANASVTNGIMTVPGTGEKLFFRYRKL